VDNSVDEALAGYCNNIHVIMLPDDVIRVEDDGRGIPTGIHPKMKKSAVEVALTMLHAGGKFDNDNYKVSGGLHGVGVSVVNALSEWLSVKVDQEGEAHEQMYHRGKPDEPVKVTGKTKLTGTTISFKADHEIFPSTEYSYDTLKHRLRELAFLNKGSYFAARRTHGNRERRKLLLFGGLMSFIEYLERGKDILNPSVIYFEKSAPECELEVAMQYTDSYTRAFCVCE
jgi:DNA gyrase subunit B